jgi:cyclopropane fatty-acyl-phospholipid synthase-like methyltransferase
MSRPRDDYLCGVGKNGHSRLAILNAANKDHIKILLEKLHLEPSMSVLDIACGTGEITCQIAETYPSVHVVGIDFSDDQIKIAKENSKNKKLVNITFIVMSAYDIKTLAEQHPRFFGINLGKFISS